MKSNKRRFKVINRNGDGIVMSFSSDVKEELEQRTDSSKHCQLAEFAAFMAFGGSVLKMPDGNFILVMTTENILVADKFLVLAEKIFGITADNVARDYEGAKNTIIHLSISDSELVEKIVMALKWFDDDGLDKSLLVHPLLIQKECCKKAFIRGAFLAAGSLSDPNKFYHYEIVCDYEDEAEQLKNILLFFKLDAKVIVRKKNYVVYIKEGSHIVDCLNIMGAVVSQMELYNVMILKGMRNDLNRKVNCEAANINKTVAAAVKQIRDIEYIRDTVGLESLNQQLYEVALIRLESTDMNLKDIGLRLNPPVGKSGVNHRLRKISDIAARLREEGYGAAH